MHVCMYVCIFVHYVYVYQFCIHSTVCIYHVRRYMYTCLQETNKELNVQLKEQLEKHTKLEVHTYYMCVYVCMYVCIIIHVRMIDFCLLPA